MKQQTLSSARCFYALIGAQNVSKVPTKSSFSETTSQPDVHATPQEPVILLIVLPLFFFPPVHKSQLNDDALPEICHFWCVTRSPG